MRAPAIWCGAALALASAACAPDEEPELPSGLPRPLGGVYDDFGAAETDARFHALMAFPTRDVEGLERAISAMYDPASPEFRKYMSVETWMAGHAPSEADLAYVEGWLAIFGMRLERTAANRLMFEFTGTVEQFNRAFKTELRRFEQKNPAEGQPITTFGALSPLRVPQKVADLAAGVVAMEVPDETGDLPKEGGDIVTEFPADKDVKDAYTPAQIAGAYAVDRLTAGGHDGEGVKIGLVVGATFKLKDLQSFWRTFGISRDNPTSIDTMDPVITRYLETSLDTEWAGAMAPGADIISYQGPNAKGVSILYTFNEAIARGEVSVLSTSFAHREETETAAARAQYSDSARMGAALGMTIVSASGDSAQPDIPSSSPYVTCVGGTRLELDETGAVKSEEAWSDSGSGAARTFDLPSWQAGVVTDSGGKRAVTDVAMNAAPRLKTSATPGGDYWLYYLGKWDHRAGTSFAAPAFAGLIAVVNSQRIADGKPVVGWINPALYQVPAVQAAFRDITRGKTPFYEAGPGWDYPTGWGAPLADKLAKALP